MIPAALIPIILPHIPELAKLITTELRKAGYVQSVRDNADFQRAVVSASAEVSQRLQAQAALSEEPGTHAQ